MDKNLSARFGAIRAHYDGAMPAVRAGNADPYDLAVDMTPIEAAVWIDIRGAGLPFFPQVPVLSYFLDFADPVKKINIECDGKQWHDPAKDVLRDAKLRADGWTIYRLPGWKCKRVAMTPGELLSEEREQGYSKNEAAERIKSRVRDWYFNTSSGVIKALAFFQYGGACEHDRFALEALSEHRSAGM